MEMNFKCPYCGQTWIQTDIKTLLWFSVSCSYCHFPIQPEDIEPSILTDVKVFGFDLCRRFMRLTMLISDAVRTQTEIPAYYGKQAKYQAYFLSHIDKAVEKIEAVQSQKLNSGGDKPT